MNAGAASARINDTPLRRSEGHFEAAGKRRLFERAWQPEKPRRHLVFVHGFAEHSGRYERMARWFAGNRSRVTAFDHQGHGRSSGTRCHVDRFDHFLDDLDAVVERARTLDEELPIYVVAHSMGGLIACAWARERNPRINGLLVSSPLLSLPEGIGGTKLAVLRTMRHVAPRLSIASELDPEGLSRDPAVAAAYLADPLVHLRMTLGLVSELFGAIERTANGGSAVTLPMMMMHGEADPICSPAASEAFAQGVSNCRYRLYRDLRHEIFNEPEQASIFEAMQTWIDEQEARRS